MKKSAAFIIVCAMTLFSLIGCGDPVNGEDVFATLNALVESTDGFTLTVESTAHGEKLTSSYVVDYTDDGYTVSYTYEFFKAIDILNPEDGCKGEKSGTAAVVNGEIANIDGDDIDSLPNRLTLLFSSDCLSDISLDDGYFKANVSDSARFIQQNSAEGAEDMAVEIVYTEAAFESIVISYAYNASQVILTYTFN